jgi:hypothetical protein
MFSSGPGRIIRRFPSAPRALFVERTLRVPLRSSRQKIFDLLNSQIELGFWPKA